MAPRRPLLRNYTAGGDAFDLTATANPKFLAGANFGKVPTEWRATNLPGGYSVEFVPSKGGARTFLPTTAFTNTGAGTALKFTLTPPATLGGRILINSAGGTTAGKLSVDLSQYNLGDSNAAAATAAAAALTTFLNANLGSVTGSTYTVTVNTSTGVVSVTPSGGGSAGETLTVTFSTANEWVTLLSGPSLQYCALRVFSAAGTELAAGAYPAAIQADALNLELSAKMYKGM